MKLNDLIERLKALTEKGYGDDEVLVDVEVESCDFRLIGIKKVVPARYVVLELDYNNPNLWEW